MNIYQTDGNGYYTGESEADLSPLEPGRFLIPGGATTIAPPMAGVTQWAKFAAGAWSLVADFRGVEYWSAAHVKTVIKHRGITVPAGTFSSNPPLTQAEIDLAASNQAKLDLIDLDARSVRSIREYIVAKADAPAILKIYDASSAIARAKVLP